LRAELALRELRERAPGRNYMVSIHGNLDGSCEVFVKGAPDEVLALCGRERTASGSHRLARRARKRALEWNARLAARGLRVLGLATGTLAPGETWQTARHELHWVGLVGMEDPVRGEAREAV